jgi:hypothetical protein
VRRNADCRGRTNRFNCAIEFNNEYVNDGAEFDNNDSTEFNNEFFDDCSITGRCRFDVRRGTSSN